MKFILIIISLCINQGFAATHHPQDFLKSIAGSKTEGKQIVQHYCAMCHAEKPLIQLGAPRMYQTSDWGARVKQGIDVLLQHTDEGFNAMPARGGCFECTDQQLKLAILAMLPQALRIQITSSKKT